MDQKEMFEEFEQMEEQAEQGQPLTVEQLDDLVKQYKEARDKHEDAKAVVFELYKERERLENELMGALTKRGKKAYEVDGIGRVTRVMEIIYATPKSNEEKKALFDYMKDKYGPDFLMATVSINHQKLNSWAKAEVESTGLSKIPGLELPTTAEYIQFRKR